MKRTTTPVEHYFQSGLAGASDHGVQGSRPQNENLGRVLVLIPHGTRELRFSYSWAPSVRAVKPDSMGYDRSASSELALVLANRFKRPHSVLQPNDRETGQRWQADRPLEDHNASPSWLVWNSPIIVQRTAHGCGVGSPKKKIRARQPRSEASYISNNKGLFVAAG
jgi:hypothetical protein